MKWEKYDEGWAMPIKSWCENCEEGAVKQAENLARHPALFHHVALMPDAHLGYGMPIGGVVAADNAVIPAAVGVDIGCGMIAVETDVPASRFAEMSFRRAFQEKLKTRIPVGEGVSLKTTQNWDGFESYTANNGMRSDLWPSKLDRMNLGTLGGGNHFIELQRTTALDGTALDDDESKVWIMIHFGSRNLGKRIEEHYRATSAKLDEIGIIPGSMGTASYIVRGLDNPESFMSCSHGSGRCMSRVRASTTLTVEECDKAMEGIVCERWHPYRGFGKAKGNLDLSEAPQAYKDIECVIDAERDLVEPLVRLVPIANLKG